MGDSGHSRATRTSGAIHYFGKSSLNMTDLRWDRIILLVGQKEVEEFLSEDIEESLQEEEKDEEA